MPQRAYRLFLPAAALLAILPLLLRGPSCGHDFDFHLLSWLEASTQFAAHAFPRWAFTPAWNAGEPRFIFYPPLSWSLGALLGLILPWTLVPIAFTWIALALAGLTFHAFARRFVPPPAALLAATFYLANPYMLFTAYERTAFAELLAAAFLPLLLAAALARRPRLLSLALPLALIWLTNAPAAVMSTYALAFIILIRLLFPARPSSLPSSLLPLPSALKPRVHLALTASAATLLGLALAAFYILPAAYERRFVQINMVIIPGMRVTDHFLFHHMPGHTPDDAFHDAVVRTASWIAIGILAAIAALLVLIARKLSAPAATKAPTPAILPLALLALLIAFLLTPLSLPLWNHLPELAFLQFPWRLTALLGAMLATLAALALKSFPLPSSLFPPPSWFSKRSFPLPSSLFPLPCVLTVLALTLPAYKTFQQPCDLEDAVPARVALFHSNLGSEATDEYTPIGADADALHPHDPPFWLIPHTSAPDEQGDSDEQDAPAPPASPPGPAPAHLAISVPAPEILVLNRRQYPAWQLSVNGHPVPPGAPKRDDGLIWVALPPGPGTIDLTLIHTPDQTAGLAISLTALAGVLATLLIRKRSLPSSQPTSPPRPPQPGVTRP